MALLRKSTEMSWVNFDLHKSTTLDRLTGPLYTLRTRENMHLESFYAVTCDNLFLGHVTYLSNNLVRFVT